MYLIVPCEIIYILINKIVICLSQICANMYDVFLLIVHHHSIINRSPQNISYMELDLNREIQHAWNLAYAFSSDSNYCRSHRSLAWLCDVNCICGSLHAL